MQRLGEDGRVPLTALFRYIRKQKGARERRGTRVRAPSGSGVGVQCNLFVEVVRRAGRMKKPAGNGARRVVAALPWRSERRGRFRAPFQPTEPTHSVPSPFSARSPVYHQ